MLREVYLIIQKKTPKYLLLDRYKKQANEQFQKLNMLWATAHFTKGEIQMQYFFIEHFKYDIMVLLNRP